MKKFVAVVVMAVLGCRMGWAQTSAASGPDAPVLQEILTEMRGIHNDVRLSETTQILLTELEVQRGAVDKTMEKRDSARTRLSQLQMNEKNFTTQAARLEETAKTTLDPVQYKRIEDQMENMKTTASTMKDQEPDAVTALQDAEGALRKEQETLDGIQDQLNNVVKLLQPAAK
jgi:hypothetical protein